MLQNTIKFNNKESYFFSEIKILFYYLLLLVRTLVSAIEIVT